MPKRKTTVDALAVEAFARHKLRSEGKGRWYCGRPGSGLYHFRLITAPGCILLYGDIGQAILLCQAVDALAWLRKAISDRDYVLGKSCFAQKDRWGWMPQDLWHYHALETFCRLLDEGKELICGETDEECRAQA